MEAHQYSRVPADFRRLHQVCIMKQFAPCVVVLSFTSLQRQGRHKVKPSKLHAPFSRPVVIHFLLPQGKSAEYYPSLYKCLSPIEMISQFLLQNSSPTNRPFILSGDVVMVQQGECQKGQVRQTVLTVVESGREKMCASNRNTDPCYQVDRCPKTQ